MGRKNLPCSTVKAHTVKSTGALLLSKSKASSMVSESLPPDNATATRSPSRIILKRAIASPTLRNIVFSTSKFLLSLSPEFRGEKAEPGLFQAVQNEPVRLQKRPVI